MDEDQATVPTDVVSVEDVTETNEATVEEVVEEAAAEEAPEEAAVEEAADEVTPEEVSEEDAAVAEELARVSAEADEAARKAKEDLQAKADALAAERSEKLESEVKSVLDVIADATDNVTSAVAEEANAVIETISENVSSVTEAVSEQISNVTEAVNEEVAAVKEAVSEEVAAVKEAVSEATTDAAENTDAATDAAQTTDAATDATDRAAPAGDATDDGKSDEAKLMERIAAAALIQAEQEEHKPVSENPASIFDNIQEEPEEEEENLTEEERRLKKADEQKALGNAAHAQGDHEGAIDHYSQAIELNPSNHVFYSNRALQYYILDRLDEADQDCDACLKLNPTFSKIYLRKCQILEKRASLQENRTTRMKMWRKALDVYTSACAQFPSFTQLANARTHLYHQISLEASRMRKMKEFACSKFKIQQFLSWRHDSQQQGDVAECFAFCEDPKDQTPQFPNMLIMAILVTRKRELAPLVQQQIVNVKISSPEAQEAEVFKVEHEKYMCHKMSWNQMAPATAKQAAVKTDSIAYFLASEGLLVNIYFQCRTDSENRLEEIYSFDRIVKSLEITYKPEHKLARQWLMKNVHEEGILLRVPPRWRDLPIELPAEPLPPVGKYRGCGSSVQALKAYEYSWAHGSVEMIVIRDFIARHSFKSYVEAFIAMLERSGAKDMTRNPADKKHVQAPFASDSVSWYSDKEKLTYSQAYFYDATSEEVITLTFKYTFSKPMENLDDRRDPDIERAEAIFMRTRIASSINIVKSESDLNVENLQTWEDIENSFAVTFSKKLHPELGGSPAVMLELSLKSEPGTQGQLFSVVINKLNRKMFDADAQPAFICNQLLASSIENIENVGKDEATHLGKVRATGRIVTGTLRMKEQIMHVKVYFRVCFQGENLWAIFMLSEDSYFEKRKQLFGNKVMDSFTFLR